MELWKDSASSCWWVMAMVATVCYAQKLGEVFEAARNQKAPSYKLLHNDDMKEMLGVSTLEGGKGAIRRRLITTAFHLDKLKVLPLLHMRAPNLQLYFRTCKYVGPQFRILPAGVIAQTACAIRYEEGKKKFKLQKEQAVLVLELFYCTYIPGFLVIKPETFAKGVSKGIKESNRLLFIWLGYQILSRPKLRNDRGKDGTSYFWFELSLSSASTWYSHFLHQSLTSLRGKE
ncbi:Uncharacterized protein TCM_037382 [Theobroma cacao]|uniref:Uncharacterized protein n=1 Tax=Theobroma cacao TaxID=3641 RepID=A0A061GKU2_THECC|nr:Uncharacterized protein TCM_037382 [Theobroma cacao]